MPFFFVLLCVMSLSAWAWQAPVVSATPTYSVDSPIRQQRPRSTPNHPGRVLSPRITSNIVSSSQITSHRATFSHAMSPRATPPRLMTVAKPSMTDTSHQPKLSHQVKSSGSLVSSSHPICIVIDPGHGGKDPGAMGMHGLHEKVVVLAIAEQLARELRRIPGFQVKLTRHRDAYLTLRQRRTLARRDHADLFISIHADAFHYRHAHGASVFALSLHGATSEAARWLARHENAVERIGDVKLNHYKDPWVRATLVHMQQDAVIAKSLQVGQHILQQLEKVAVLHADHVERAGFLVLMAPDLPSLLIETGFVSNPREAALLRHHRYQARLAHAIAVGVVDYYRQRAVLL